jgi:hypothetical protein
VTGARALLHFLYKGSLPPGMPQTELVHTLDLADRYAAPGAAAACLDALLLPPLRSFEWATLRLVLSLPACVLDGADMAQLVHKCADKLHAELGADVEAAAACGEARHRLLGLPFAALKLLLEDERTAAGGGGRAAGSPRCVALRGAVSARRVVMEVWADCRAVQLHAASLMCDTCGVPQRVATSLWLQYEAYCHAVMGKYMQEATGQFLGHHCLNVAGAPCLPCAASENTVLCLVNDWIGHQQQAQHASGDGAPVQDEGEGPAPSDVGAEERLALVQALRVPQLEPMCMATGGRRRQGGQWMRGWHAPVSVLACAL